MTNHFEFKIRIIKTNIINMNLYEANYKIIERFLFFEIMHFIIQDKYSYPWKRGYQYSYMTLSHDALKISFTKEFTHSAK